MTSFSAAPVRGTVYVWMVPGALAPNRLSEARRP
jgi:hypothetical protein